MRNVKTEQVVSNVFSTNFRPVASAFRPGKNSNSYFQGVFIECVRTTGCRSAVHFRGACAMHTNGPLLCYMLSGSRTASEYCNYAALYWISFSSTRRRQTPLPPPFFTVRKMEF